MQRDTTGLTAENKELKLRLQAMEEQSHLRDGMHFFNCVHAIYKEGIMESHGLVDTFFTFRISYEVQ